MAGVGRGRLPDRDHALRGRRDDALSRVRGGGLGSMEPAGPMDALARHWPEYLMEAWGLGIFMVSAGLCTVLVIHPASPLATLDPLLQRVLIGSLMGLTAVGIIYSPWGRQS